MTIAEVLNHDNDSFICSWTECAAIAAISWGMGTAL